MELGNMFDENCKGCCIEECVKNDHVCPYLVSVMDDSMTRCFCCGDHEDICRDDTRDKQ